MSAAHDKPALTPRQRAQARQAIPPAITQLDPGKVDERLAGWRWGRQGGEDGAPYEFRLTGPDGWATKFYQNDTKAIAEALRRVRSQPQQKEPAMTALATQSTAPAQLALFDYEQLDVETRIVVRERATQARDEIRRLASLVRQTAETVWALGEKLGDVQARLAPDGLWSAWCDAELPGVSRGTIYNAINVYKAFPQLPTVGNGEALDVPLRALYLLAAPGTPEEAREEAAQLLEAGEVISVADAQVIVAKHKPAPAQAPAPQRAPEPALEEEELTPYEQQIAAAYVPPAPLTPVAPPSAVVEGEVIATAPAAPAPAPALTPLAAAPAVLTPLTPLAATPADASALKTAEALVALLEQASAVARVERDRLQRELPDAHYQLPDEPVEQAARMFLANPAVRAAAGFLAMSAREAQ